MKALLRLALLLLALPISLLASAPAAADPADIDAAARGVVRVIVIMGEGEDMEPVSHGSGFAVDAETVVTNAHVVAEAVEDRSLAIGIVPSAGGNAVMGRVLSVSPRNDLALIRTTQPMRLSPLTIAGNAPANATGVLAIGYPMNVDQAQGLGAADLFRAQPPVTSQGFLSGRRPSRDFDTLLHTAPIARGNSGGPLVDQCGRVVGVNAFGAESDATEAEFFFAVSMRELLPFLRANNVTPQINGLPCRSIEELDAAERARAEEAAQSAAAAADAAEQEENAQAAELREAALFSVLDQRATLTVLALLALIGAVAGLGWAWRAHQREDLPQRKLGAIVGGVALLVALVAFVLRPGYADVAKRVEDGLQQAREAAAAGADETALADAPEAGSFACVLDTSRSRVIGAPVASVALDWSAQGCVNRRTQYGAVAGEWSRVLVPSDEDVVSVNRFDPARAEYVVDRYLLDRDALVPLREARATYQAPACNAGAEAVNQLGQQQKAILDMLPDRPNERLIYDCSGRLSQPPEPPAQ